MDFLNCQYDTPQRFDPPELLHKLYGRHFDAHSSAGRGNIAVLGAHNSGTSMVTRLIMLLGAFAGNFETISIHRHNKLKYYEQFPLAFFHDAFLRKFVDTRFRPYHAQGLNFSTITEADYAQLQVRCAARATLLATACALTRHMQSVNKSMHAASRGVVCDVILRCCSAD